MPVNGKKITAIHLTNKLDQSHTLINNVFIVQNTVKFM